MVALVWLVNILSPFVTILGIIGMAWGLDDAPFELCLWGSLACFIVGFIFGIIAWKNDVPPRWFWIKSKMGLFSVVRSPLKNTMYHYDYGLERDSFGYSYYILDYISTPAWKQ